MENIKNEHASPMNAIMMRVDDKESEERRETLPLLETLYDRAQPSVNRVVPYPDWRQSLTVTTLDADAVPRLDDLRASRRLVQAELQQRLSSEILDRCGTGAILVTADSRIIFANRPASALLGQRIGICSRHHRLTALRDTDAKRLAELILRAGDSNSVIPNKDGIMLLRVSDRQLLSVLVAPFNLKMPGRPGAGAIVFIRDGSRLLSATEALRTLFDLTPTEARIAQALANAKSIAQIASAHGVNEQTVRKQLKVIFSKTATSRQAECVAVILLSIAAIARE